MFTFHLHIWFTLNWTNNITLRFINFPFHCVVRCCEPLLHYTTLSYRRLVHFNPFHAIVFICHRVVKICKVVCSRQREASEGGGEAANLCTHKDFPILKLIYIVDGMKIFVITKQNLSLRNSLKFVWARRPAVFLHSQGRILNSREVRQWQSWRMSFPCSRRVILSISSMKIIRRRSNTLHTKKFSASSHPKPRLKSL